MKTLVPLLLLVVTGVLTLNSRCYSSDEACPLAFHQVHLCADMTWILPPVAGALSSFRLRFWPQNSALQNRGNPAFSDPAGELAVQLWMNMGGHGHGSAPVRIVRAQPQIDPMPGVFYIERVAFIMPGTWDIRISINSVNTHEVLDQVVVPLAISRP